MDIHPILLPGPDGPSDQVSTKAGALHRENLGIIGGLVDGEGEAQAVKWIWRTRTELGADQGISRIGLEKVGDKTISVVHQVELDGRIIHQHQTHIGLNGKTERQFPSSWIQFPDVNAP